MCASTLNILYLRLKLASSYNKNNASCNIHERWTAHTREWCAVNVRCDTLFRRELDAVPRELFLYILLVTQQCLPNHLTFSRE